MAYYRSFHCMSKCFKRAQQLKGDKLLIASTMRPAYEFGFDVSSMNMVFSKSLPLDFSFTSKE